MTVSKYACVSNSQCLPAPKLEQLLLVLLCCFSSVRSGFLWEWSEVEWSSWYSGGGIVVREVKGKFFPTQTQVCFLPLQKSSMHAMRISYTPAYLLLWLSVPWHGLLWQDTLTDKIYVRLVKPFKKKRKRNIFI